MCVCVLSSFFDHTTKSVPQKSNEKQRGVQIRDTTQKKKETTTPTPKRNAPPVIDDAGVLHSRRAGGGVSEHLFSRSPVSKKGWCSDDFFDAF